MINKIKNFNIIKSKIKSILFFKYIILIFILSLSIYIGGLKFVNFEKKIDILKSGLKNNHGLKLSKIENISYNIFPSPRLIIRNSKASFFDDDLKGTIKELIIILDVTKLYKFKESRLNKIYFIDSKFIAKKKDLKKIINKLDKTKNKIYFKNASLNIQEKNKTILEFKNLDLKNKNKLEISTSLFGYKTQIKFLKTSNKKLILKIPELGIFTDVYFTEKANFENLEGLVEAKILKNNLKFNFKKKEKIIISNSFFRNRFFQTSFDGDVTIDPFFYFDLNLKVKYINFDKLKAINLISKIYNFSENRKKFNGKINLVFNKERFKTGSINNMSINAFSKNGEIKFNQVTLKFPWGNLYLIGGISEYEGYQKFNFKTEIDLIDEKKFSKTFSINKNKLIERTKIKINGYLNISSNKIFFEEIKFNDEQFVSNKDKDYYKKLFEERVIGNNIFNIFNLKNLNNFFDEIY